MTQRDRAGDLSGQRAGRRSAAGDAGPSSMLSDARTYSPTAGSPARPGLFPKFGGELSAGGAAASGPGWL